jgi:hypothetical protein
LFQPGDKRKEREKRQKDIWRWEEEKDRKERRQ